MSEQDEHAKNKAKVEALLFATNGLTVDEIVKRTGINKREVRKILDELELEYLDESKGVQVVNEGEIWKMSVKPEHTPNVKDLLPPEMPKSLIKTLAVIAANKPIKQSTVVKVRGNKAYDHIKRLEKMGFIITEKHGTTQLIDLTEKFFEYFQVVESELKEKVKQHVGEESENLKA
ncbi:MAG: SMC-Scp complex subunit ScpB [Nanoarchaeota archaeon]|nr:SMC-Scp complex subunit ScpB [Nanoarchaeota archaeon]